MTRAGLAFVCMLIAAQRTGATPITEIHYVMGTYLRVTVDHDDETAARSAMRRCAVGARHLEEVFSRFDGRSELSRLNATPVGDGPVTVSADMAALLDRALRLRDVTDGAFDIGVGALTHLWRSADHWPARSEIERAQNTLGLDVLALTGTTLVRHADVVIDVDGVAKGWTVDRCVATLRGAGIRRAFISFGESSLYALGTPAGRDAWPVLVRALDGASALGVLQLRDEAVSVSAVLGRERLLAGRRVGHIVNPTTGLPLTRPALSVVVAPSATDAEAFSKAVLIQGGRRPCRTQPTRRCAPQVRAILVDERGLHRFGRVPFSPRAYGLPIPASAEVVG